MSSSPTPRLSFLVVVYGIPRQAENTLYSLSTRHQRNCSEAEYEIVVVENRSAALLGEERALSFGRNVRYHLRDEPGVSPVPALNFAFEQSRGEMVGLLIDGARMATPRLVEHVLAARGLSERPLVVAPGYHLGPEPQYLSAPKGYDESVEREMLGRIAWKTDGYALFDVACFDDTNENGLVNPFLESTCLSCPRECFEEIGRADPRFVSSGGGIVNLDLFERLCRLPRTRLIVLCGEGAFHQYHGGTSSSGDANRERKLAAFRAEYERVRGRPFRGFDREPLLFGVLPPQAQPFILKSVDFGLLRFGIVREWGVPFWNDPEVK
ncbi:MAG TPA: hypothetical protein VHE30_13640 [Polyangiaceae bacterium]|nr:hypothetical protein [Polyangiaceae bacterium]